MKAAEIESKMSVFFVHSFRLIVYRLDHQLNQSFANIDIVPRNNCDFIVADRNKKNLKRTIFCPVCHLLFCKLNSLFFIVIFYFNS